jgi:hypothetical protein
LKIIRHKIIYQGIAARATVFKGGCGGGGGGVGGETVTDPLPLLVVAPALALTVASPPPPPQAVNRAAIMTTDKTFLNMLLKYIFDG